MENFFNSWLLLSSFFFISIYILGHSVIFARRWPRGSGAAERCKAASCCMSIVHGTSTSLAAILYICSMRKSPPHSNQYVPWLNAHLGAPNTPFQEALMEYSTAYFLMDLLHYFLFAPNNPLFILHHILTISYMLSCRFYTRHGGFSTILLFIVGECTSFLQNLWSLASLTDNKSLFNALNVPFLTMFSVFRGIVMPWTAWQLCAYYLWSADANTQVPFWVAMFWMGSLWVGISGSLIWVAVHWAKLLMISKTSSKDVEPPAKAEHLEKRRKYV